jgi:Phage integrase family
MQWAPDPTDLWAPDSEHARAWASDSNGHLTLIQAVDLFLAAKAAEGISPKTSSWYRMILARLAHAFEPSRPVDGLSAPEIRAWLLKLRTTLAPVSVAGYVRTLKAFGNWLHAEELAEAGAFRSLRKPRVPVKLIEPVRRHPPPVARSCLGARSGDPPAPPRHRPAGVRGGRHPAPRPTLGWLGQGHGQGCERTDRPDRLDRARGDRSLHRSAWTGHPRRAALPRPARRPRLAGMQQVLKRLKTRAGVTGRCSPHSLRHTFARSYLVNGGDVFSLQQILGHTTLDMVKRYVSLADADVAAKHRVASPADRLMGKPGR